MTLSPPPPLSPPPLFATGIFGEYDRYFFPSIVDKAASGKLKYIIGSGANRFDWTYAGNVAQAHEMACRTLVSGEAGALGGSGGWGWEKACRRALAGAGERLRCAVARTHVVFFCTLTPSAVTLLFRPAPPHYPPSRPLPSPPLPARVYTPPLSAVYAFTPLLPPRNAVALTPTSALAGAVYFITNDDARPFWGFLGDLVAPLGYPRPRVHLPLWLVLALACLVEAVAALLAPFGVVWETDFTRSRMVLASCERRVSCAAARRDFGYIPEVGVDEAVRRTVAHFEGLRAK